MVLAEVGDPGQEAILAIASERETQLFDPKGRDWAFFSFGMDDASLPSDRLSLAWDIDGDGFRDFVADISGAWNIFSLHFARMLGAHSAADGSA